jgi:hypothetical protein
MFAEGFASAKEKATTALSAAANSQFVQRDLARGSSGGLIAGMGSFSSNLGFQTTQLAGVDHRTAVFMNRIVNKDMFGPSAQFVTSQGRPARSLEDAMSRSDIKNTRINRGLYRTGVRGMAGGFVGPAMVALQGIGGYLSSRDQGHGMVRSIGAGAANVATGLVAARVMSAVVGNPYAVAGLATVGGAYMLARSTINAVNQGNMYRSVRGAHELSGHASGSMHTRPAATMRQRALASINNSQFNAMRSLGNEASFMRSPRSRYGDTSQGPVPRPILGY